MAADPPGRDTGVLLWKEPSRHEAGEYIVVPCVPVWLPSMHWAGESCYCPDVRKR